MRNRGRSSRVEDGRLLSIQKDVEDLEAVRRHFGVERFVRRGHALLGQHLGHPLAVTDVHLAAEAFDFESLGGHSLPAIGEWAGNLKRSVAPIASRA